MGSVSEFRKAIHRATVDGVYWYHAAAVQGADIRIAARAFSLKVACQIFTRGDGMMAATGPL